MAAIRDCRARDHDAIVELALRAWAPVFSSVHELLGRELATLLHGADWRRHQAGEVRAALRDAAKRVWVAESDGRIVGFVAATVVDEVRLIGEIFMVAVDPAAQRQRIGGSLTEHATTWLREQGMRVAMIGTGGDPGHEPARRVYDRLGFRLLPSAQYFRALHPSQPTSAASGCGAMSSAPCNRPGDMAERDPMLEPFDALIGTWTTEAKHRMVDEVVYGSVTYEWLEGGHFVIQRSQTDDERFPDGLSVIGAPEDGDGLVMEYFDSRGVRRTYGVSFDNGVLRIWRDAAGFDQRFSAKFAGDVYEGVFEYAETPGDWQHDMKVIYRRRD